METKVNKKAAPLGLLEVKTIDINALEWFDRVNGNSYFAGSVTVNYGMEGSVVINMPFQYGYGDSYRYKAIEVLKDRGYIDTDKEYLLRDKGIIVRAGIVRGCLKKELKRFND